MKKMLLANASSSILKNGREKLINLKKQTFCDQIILGWLKEFKGIIKNK